MSASLLVKPENIRNSVLLSLFVCLFVGMPSPAAAQLDKNQQSAALCDSGFVALEHEDIKSAYKLFRQALRIKWDSSSALLGLGRVMLRNPAGGMRAVDYLSKAVQLDPDNPEIHYYKALAHLRMSGRGINHQSRIALEELEKVIELNPEHSDAYYQRGLIILYRHHDFERALESFRKQIEINPDHKEALAALPEENIGLSIRALGFRSWNEAVEAAAGKPEEAMQVFDSYFKFLSEKEHDLYFNLELILSPDEQETYTALDEIGKRTYWNHYWRNRDPDPNSSVNECLLEHFLRIAYARSEFGREGNQWPWDKRGDFYVRYGEPDFRAVPTKLYPAILLEDNVDFFIMKRDLERKLGISPYPPDYDISLLNEQLFGFDLPTVLSIPNERWFYLDLGLVMAFGNPMQDELFILSANDRLLDAMARYLPVVSNVESTVEIFKPLQSVVTFRGNEGKTVFVYSIGLLANDIPGFRDQPGEYIDLNAKVELLSEDWHPITDSNIKVRSLSSIQQTDILGIHLFIDIAELEVESGDYILSTFFIDPERRTRSYQYQSITLPNYLGSHLMLSDILPVIYIGEGESGREVTLTRGNMEMIPFPGRALEFNRSLSIYYEIYNLTKDRFGSTDYRIDYSISIAPYREDQYARLYQDYQRPTGRKEERPLVTSSFTQRGIDSDVVTHLEIDLSEFVAKIDRLEIYELALHIVDNLTGATASRSFLFRVLPDW